MKDSLFRRYFSIYSLTLILCTLLLGVALLYFAAQFFREDNQNSLEASAQKAAQITEENLSDNHGGYVSRAVVEDAYALICKTSGNTVFFCDVSGRVQMCSEEDECRHGTYVVPQRILQAAAKNGSYSDVGYLGGFFKDSGKYSYGMPLSVEGEVRGFIFAFASLDALYTFLTQISAMFLLSSLIMLAASSVIIYYSTRILTKPLREMSSAAKGFASGDFSARVTVTGDDEIGRLARVFNDMAVSLAELENVRRSFVANVSHELRTPMTTIGGYIDGILDGTIPRGAQKHYLQIASDEVKRLARLSQSLLEITRMDAGEQQLTMESVNIYDIAVAVLINAELRINEKKLDILGADAGPLYVNCDRDKLYQIIYNLLDNAIKFTPEGGTISFSSHVKQADSFFCIRNTGAGVPAEELKHIFERFYKTDKSRSLDKSGTGLGLYIAKTLTQKMDGDLTAASNAGEYTEFTIMLKTGQTPETVKTLAEAPPHRKGLFGRVAKGLAPKEKKKKDGKKDA